jgi:hypothetical protein
MHNQMDNGERSIASPACWIANEPDGIALLPPRQLRKHELAPSSEWPPKITP